MTYAFPDSLAALSDWLRRQGADVGSFKTERQAAFMAQQLAGTRFKFPAKGASCFTVLQSIQKAVTDGRTSKAAGTRQRSSPARGKGGDKKASIERRSCPRVDGNAAGWGVGLSIFCDGACDPNPGIGGWGFAVYRDGVEIHADCGGDLKATNQTMELTAATNALLWYYEADLRERLRLFSDSMYVVNGCNDWRHGWKKKGRRRGVEKELANAELWKALDALLVRIPVELEWCKGHAGIIGNERADELSLMGRETVIEVKPDPLDLIRQQLDYSARGGV